MNGIVKLSALEFLTLQEQRIGVYMEELKEAYILMRKCIKQASMPVQDEAFWEEVRRWLDEKQRKLDQFGA